MRNKVRKLRMRHRPRLSQQALADKAGVSLRTIQNLEAGMLPRTETAAKIARALGVRIDTLFEKESA